MNARRLLRAAPLASLLALAPPAVAGGNEIVVLSVPPPGSQTSMPSAEVRGFVIGDPGPQTVDEVYFRTRYPLGGFDPPFNSEGAHDPSVLGWGYAVTDWDPLTGVGVFEGRAKLFDVGQNFIQIYLPGDTFGAPSYEQSIQFQPESIDPSDVVLNVLPVQRSVDVVEVSGSSGALEFRLDVINTTVAQTYTVDVVAMVELPDGSMVNLPMGGPGVDAATFTVAPGDFQYTSAVDPEGMRFSFPLDQAPFPQPVQEGAYEMCVQAFDGPALLHFEQFVSYWVSDRSGKAFRDATDELGLGGVALQGGNRPSPGNQIAVFDHNLDGLQDLFFTNPSSSQTFLPIGSNWPYPGGRNYLMENLGTGSFDDVTAAAGVEGDPSIGSYGVAWGDLDADGDPELVVANRAAPNYVYRNDGDSTFTDVAETSFGGPVTSWQYVPRLGDHDGDGDLDLYVGSYLKQWSTTWANEGWDNALYRNELMEGVMDPLAPGFPVFTKLSNTGTESAGNTLGAVWTDQDRDGRLDLFVHNDFGPAAVPNQMFKGSGTGTFTDVSGPAGFDIAEMSMGAAFADYDGDLLPDMYSCSLGRNSLLLNSGAGFVVQSIVGSGAEGSFVTEGPHADGTALDDSWAALPFDFDLDGDLDVFTVGAYLFTSFNMPVPELNPDALYENDGTAHFTKRSEELGLANAASGRGAVLVDLDQDGDLDVVTSNENEGVTAMRNDHVTPYTYLRLRPVATRSAPGGFNTILQVEGASSGTRVRETNTVSSSAGQMDGSETFGMRDDATATVRADWQRGGRTTYYQVPTGGEFLVHEAVIEIEDKLAASVPVGTAPKVELLGEPGAFVIAFVGNPSISFGVPLPGVPGESTDIFPIVDTMTTFVLPPGGVADWNLGTVPANLAGVELELQMLEYDAVGGVVPMLSGVSRMILTD